ncbi:DUF2147 domain-containing protein [Tenacibaculum tangerinum]|uniref:DUF2147 domain-containing protein n=1 Tax=Tenacibaculum tangerinum TaxID=3038772 RepID=A0ABY8L623_9FLAO|nr:DUF2147 domain-containing protein [Tenacibaculum tangerinum]WGH75494.1 DUF2147 domain-containing protein [Tenacibaculum tangerinum]
MKKPFLTLLFTFVILSVNSQTIFGTWENRNEETNKVDSVIEVYEKDGKAYAKIIEITDKNRQDAICDKCEDANKNKPILGMNILTGLSKDGNEWSGGKILDPKNGKVYECFIKLVGENKLKVRGFLGISLFGRTVYWHRKK